MRRSKVTNVSKFVDGQLISKSTYVSQYEDVKKQRSPIFNVLTIFIFIMLFITLLRVSFGGSDFIFTDLISFFANFSNINFSIPAISTISTGIGIIDTLFNSFISAVNCITFIFSTLINVCLFLSYIVAFIFSF